MLMEVINLLRVTLLNNGKIYGCVRDTQAWFVAP
jgi:hypothetical protein